jgi:ribosomal protein L31
MKTDKQLSEGSWLRDVPFDTRGHGVQDAVSAYKTCMTNKTKGNISHFKLRFKSVKDPSHIFWISKKAMMQNEADVKIFKQRLKGNSKLRFTKKDKVWLKTHTLDNDAKIQRAAK